MTSVEHFAPTGWALLAHLKPQETTMTANPAPPLDNDTIGRVGRYIANDIRAELVCCDIYERLHKILDDSGDEVTDANTGGHQICYWGEVAAQIAEGQDA
jgi:hypothetical protein